MLADNYGRKLDYLRLAVTDRCNLRCTYCMPAAGLDWLRKSELMTDEEMLRICSLFVEMGIRKIRITGGEPFVRKDLIKFLEKISSLAALHDLTLTTNGVVTAPFVPELKKIGVRSVNLSLDTLDKERFIRIAHRDELNNVFRTLDALLKYDFEIKINAVVMENLNIEDIVPLVLLSKSLPVSIRFIEEMPFNGGSYKAGLHWNYKRISAHIEEYFPNIQKIPDAPSSTSYNYHIPGYLGNVGVIAAWSRLFCGTCNRIRITPSGVIRTCLYDNGKVNIKDALRNGASDEELKELIRRTISTKAKDGWEAEKNRNNHEPVRESMATIGG